MLGQIKINHDCLIVLNRTLPAVAPEEGCALILGEQMDCPGNSGHFSQHIHHIWPCCNVWGNEELNLWGGRRRQQKFLNQISKKNRFLIDPREQIHAQRWGRKHDWDVLGTCHSHPKGKPVPSKTDIEFANSARLMLILSDKKELRAWWICKKGSYTEIQLAIVKTH